MGYTKIFYSSLSILLLVYFACAGQEPRKAGVRMSESEGLMIKRDNSLDAAINRNCDFSLVGGSNLGNPCSPPIGDNEVNVIRINAPEVVYYTSNDNKPLEGKSMSFNICGACSFFSETLRIKRGFGDKILVVAVDTKTHKSYSGKIFYLETFAMPGKYETYHYKGVPDTNITIGEWFNLDLAKDYFEKLPPIDADYYVHAVLGPYKSNVLKVSLRRKKE